MNTPHPAGCRSAAVQTPEHDAKAEVDQSILDEISGRIYEVVEGFFEKHFENKTWSPSVEEIVRASTQEPPPSSVFKLTLESPSASLRGRSLFQSRLPGPRSDPKHTSHLFLVSNEFACDGDYRWAVVQVVGQFQEDTGDDYLRGFLRLCRHALEVFMSQPTLLFLHGFYVFGSVMELWIFDRSGLYSCKPFDVDTDRGRLITIIAGYKRMSDDELGINMLVKEDKAGKYIMFQGDDEPQACRLCLENEPIAFPRKIVSQGPTCYRAKRSASMNWEFVLKLSWRSDKRSREEKILRLAKERKVWGVVQLFGDQQLDTILNLRQGLLFGTSRELPSTKSAATANTGPSKTMSVSSGVANTCSVEARPIGQERLNDESILPFDDLAFCCLVVSPLGRLVDKFETILEFLEGCCDAIKGHRSLYLDGKILHQDVSKDNIVIPEMKRRGEPRGILIDLDLAMELDVGSQNSRELIGTKAFMAIELLARKPHTYRHDLESFFYVFLWIAICGGHKRLPSESRLQRWLAGSWEVLARKKAEDMAEENFEVIISEFLPEFKGLEGLARDLRKVLLFPSPDGSLFTGTSYEPEEIQRLYDKIISAFSVAADSYA